MIPSNKPGITLVDTLKTAFCGNNALADVIHVDCPLGIFNYAMWEMKVVQFFNDSLADPNGNKTMLMEDVARDVLGSDICGGIYHCTESDPNMDSAMFKWVE